MSKQANKAHDPHGIRKELALGIHDDLEVTANTLAELLTQLHEPELRTAITKVLELTVKAETELHFSLHAGLYAGMWEDEEHPQEQTQNNEQTEPQ